MAKYIYVQAQFFYESDGMEQIRFRHTEVEASDDWEAYGEGHKVFPTKDDDVEFLNDYVICVEPTPVAGDLQQARGGMKL